MVVCVLYRDIYHGMVVKGGIDAILLCCCRCMDLLVRIRRVVEWKSLNGCE